jgi:hypothetical protein
MNIQNKTKNDPKSGLQELHQVNNSSLVKSQNRIHTYTVLAYTSGIITTLIGLIVLIGWKMDLTLLKTSDCLKTFSSVNNQSSDR